MYCIMHKCFFVKVFFDISCPSLWKRPPITDHVVMLIVYIFYNFIYTYTHTHIHGLGSCNLLEYTYNICFSTPTFVFIHISRSATAVTDAGSDNIIIITYSLTMLYGSVYLTISLLQSYFAFTMLTP